MANFKTFFPALAAALVVAGGPARAHVYAWKDAATGQSRFSNIAPRRYRRSKIVSGPRVVATVGRKMIDDTALPYEERLLLARKSRDCIDKLRLRRDPRPAPDASAARATNDWGHQARAQPRFRPYWHMRMKLISVNVALPVEVQYRQGSIKTGIFKLPVKGPVHAGAHNLEGDGQADLENHGGAHKAVYAYALDHYAYWREVLAREEMNYGQFGENLTIAGLDESERCVGDRLQIGSALFAISQPRVPCYKLGIRLGDERMPKLFSQSARTGLYLSVLREGVIEAGDAVDVVERGYGTVAIKPLFEAYMNRGGKGAAQILRRALEVPELSPEWHAQIERRLAREEE